MQLIPEQPATPLSTALATIAAAEAKSKAKAKAKAADNAAAKQIAHRQISISMPATLLAQIEAQADALHMPRVTFVKMLLAQGVAAPAPAAPAPVPALPPARTPKQEEFMATLARMGIDISAGAALSGAELDRYLCNQWFMG